MENKPHIPNELASKLKYKGDHVLRATVEGVDFVFVPGNEYEDLPASDYLFSLWKQGYFEEIPVEKKGPKTAKSNSKPL